MSTFKDIAKTFPFLVPFLLSDSLICFWALFRPLEVLLLDLDSPIDLSSPAWTAAEPALQSNIVKPHGRKYTGLVLFRLHYSEGLRSHLAAFAAEFVTSAATQRLQAACRFDNPNTVSGNLFLSIFGYRELKFSNAQLESAFRRDFDRDWFLDGMASKSSHLEDDLTNLESHYRGDPPHAMLHLATDDRCGLDEMMALAQKRIQSFGQVITTERGTMLKNEAGEAIEPFGFRDGIAMPSVLGSISHPANTLLHPDRLAQDPNALGTFVVYRKLSQDVAGFDAAVQQLAKQSNVPVSYAEAMLMGRFKDGTPLSNSPVPDPALKSAEPDFANDLHGLKCPFHAHIRRVNPRTSIEIDRMTIPLFRRSSPYSSDCDAGLLFIAMQGNIEVAFGTIMKLWVNDPNFLAHNNGTDTLIGSPTSLQDWPGAALPQGVNTQYDVGRHVHYKGGEFFFAPSISFFHLLATTPA